MTRTGHTWALEDVMWEHSEPVGHQRASAGHRARIRRLDRAEVEVLGLERRRPGDDYWLSSTEAAEILGVSTTRVKQLARDGRLPAVRHGRYYRFRRHQIEVIANAREARLLLR